MQFAYWKTPTIESAICQGIGQGSCCWSHLCDAGTYNFDQALEIAQTTAEEVRQILTLQLIKLVDPEGQAREWNDAIETAMQVVEGKRTP